MDVSPTDGGIVKIQEQEDTPALYPTKYTFDTGTNVHVEAVPARGHIFNKWSGDLSGTANPNTILIDCTKSITANFTPVTTPPSSWPLVSRIIAGLSLMGLLAFFLTSRLRKS